MTDAAASSTRMSPDAERRVASPSTRPMRMSPEAVETFASPPMRSRSTSPLALLTSTRPASSAKRRSPDATSTSQAAEAAAAVDVGRRGRDLDVRAVRRVTRSAIVGAVEDEPEAAAGVAERRRAPRGRHRAGAARSARSRATPATSSPHRVDVELHDRLVTVDRLERDLARRARARRASARPACERSRASSSRPHDRPAPPPRGADRASRREPRCDRKCWKELHDSSSQDWA